MSQAAPPTAGGFRTVLNILLEPSTAFADLRRQPTWLLPALLMLGGQAAALLWYFSVLDIPWFMESLLYQGNADPSEEEIAAFREQAENISPLVFAVSGLLGGTFVLLIVWLLQAGYFTLVSALTGDGFRFRNWFCLATWTAVPALFSVVGMMITIALNPSGQISQTELDPLLLANLGLQFGDSPLNSVANVINVPYLWTLGLLVYGYRTWRGGTWLKSALIAMLPQLLFVAGLLVLLTQGLEFDVSFIEAEGGGNGSIAISLSL